MLNAKLKNKHLFLKYYLNTFKYDEEEKGKTRVAIYNNKKQLR